METTYLLILTSLILVISLVNLLRRRNISDQIKPLWQADMEKLQQNFSQMLSGEISANRREQHEISRQNRVEMTDSLEKFGHKQMKIFDMIDTRVERAMKDTEGRSEKLEKNVLQTLNRISDQVDKRLQVLQKDNAEQLEKMRETVDEKLHQTLEERLGRSFKRVSDHLEKVQMGLGEMKSLAAGVGDLKKVLSNVKTRGIMGEIQLLNIIEQVMTPDQYELNVPTIPGRDTRVEVAIKLPGKANADNATNGKGLRLPIDAKFPMDRYQALSDAYEVGCQDQIKTASTNMQRAILSAAKDIREKYVAPPYTTDFGIMFLPVEGLYAEVCRQPDLIFKLKSEYQIIVAGPNNLSAFLSSLQMGFRTLAIEKRSSEVWSLLAEIKTEFGKFGMALDKVQKKLTEANNVIDQAGVRRRAVERRLNKVEELPVGEQLSIKGASIYS